MDYNKLKTRVEENIIKKLSLILLLGVVAFGIYRYRRGLEQVIPYPYYFTTAYQTTNSWPEGSIWLVGDRSSEKLAQYLPLLSEKLSVNLSTPLKIGHHTAPALPTHRLLWQLKSLKNWPKLLLYHSSSTELTERKFLVSESSLILKNFQLASNDWVQTFIMLYPPLSRIIYHPIHWQKLSLERKDDQTTYSSSSVTQRNEISYKIFEHELREIIELAQQHKSLIALITIPLNLEVMPKSDCHQDLMTESGASLVEAEAALKKGDAKTAKGLTSELISRFPFSASLNFLHAKTLQALGDFSQARHFYQLAGVYDCQSWRGNAVYNSIMRKLATEKNILLIDFDRMVNDEWPQNQTFLDELYPQEPFYNRLITSMSEVLRRSFGL